MIKIPSEVYTRLEILCVLMWFAMDGSWLFEFGPGVYTCGIISASLALTLLLTAPNLKFMTIALADFSWLSMNLLWAMGDMLNLTWTLDAAKVLFIIGILISGVTVMWGLPLRRIRILSYFRRGL